jgi:hypothetical protein
MGMAMGCTMGCTRVSYGYCDILFPPLISQSFPGITVLLSSGFIPSLADDNGHNLEITIKVLFASVRSPINCGIFAVILRRLNGIFLLLPVQPKAVQPFIFTFYLQRFWAGTLTDSSFVRQR